MTLGHRLTRATAARHLTAFLARVRAVNADSYYLYRVRRVRLFGSMLTDAPTVGDIDLAVELVPRQTGPAHTEAEWQRRRDHVAAGHRFANAIAEAAWPMEEVLRVLKARTPRLSLHHGQEPDDLHAESRVVFEEETP